MKKIGVVSLGCPKNTVDTELLLGDLLAGGYEFTPAPEEAEVLIVNTCGFIESAKRESINAILDMAKMKTDGKCQKLIVTGCLSERYSEELLTEIGEIDHLLGVNQYPRLREILNEPEPALTSVEARNHVNEPAAYFESHTGRVLTTPFYTSYIKIGEGCSNQCAFCIIPKMRGRFRSRTPESILEEVRVFADRGVKEFNLVSQDTTMYGLDLRMKDGLVDLLRQMVTLAGVHWIRLFYCYPTFIRASLMEFMADEPKVCKYIDVPLQHIHDEMLTRMKRQERETGVRAMLEALRRKVPGIALRTTFITGFPGETDAHFQHLAGFLREAEFDHVGVFPYSDEEGTTAFHLSGKVPARVARERRDELMSIQRDIAARKNRARIGQVHPVLVEGADPAEPYLVTGRLPIQGPEIDGQVLIENSAVEPGDLVPMKITGASGYDLVATALTGQRNRRVGAASA
ncbi:MAG: 30S ribosomal protein S12 methylthiotransferase RimO [Nitrospinae bacterium CG11_big_fil_rev_8_21_14_0_20_56_8]|nr:MAG: 30S ribosomal protein S12 methylthiotransferase RimO [Nitrospinae bacterium CG11_big_fil_rev_8_21_14_0_20_56_8]